MRLTFLRHNPDVIFSATSRAAAGYGIAGVARNWGVLILPYDSGIDPPERLGTSPLFLVDALKRFVKRTRARLSREKSLQDFGNIALSAVSSAGN